MWSLVLVYPTFTIPFCTWLLMGFFKAMPPEIEEAAIVDGCSSVRRLHQDGDPAVAVRQF